jgi:arylsulfatase A-like enzyme
MKRPFFERVVVFNLGCILCSAAAKPVELFNLKSDPQQTRNLAAEHPQKVEDVDGGSKWRRGAVSGRLNLAAHMRVALRSGMIGALAAR